MNRLLILCIAAISFNGLSQEIDRFNNRYLVKLTPTQMTVGEINLGFEHRVGDQSSLELTLGPTISELGVYNSDANYGYAPGYSPQYIKAKSALGIFAALEYRFYPLSFANAPRGMYVGPSIKFRQYNTTISDFSSVLPKTRNEQSQMMFRLNFGYQFWLSDRFALDVFSGIGIELQQSKTNGLTYDNNSGVLLPQTEWTKSGSSNTRISGTIGVKVGIGR